LACPPVPDPEAEARAREEILSIQQEIGKLFTAGVPTRRFDDMVEAAKRALREGAYSKAVEEAFDTSFELEAFKRGFATSSALLSEVRTAISKAAGLGLDTTGAAAHLATADPLLKQGAFGDVKALVEPDLRWLQETLWTSDAARDAVLQAQQVLIRLSLAGADTSGGEKVLARARGEMREKRFAKALVLAHKANPDRVSLELEKQEVLKLLTRLDALVAEAQRRRLGTDDAARAVKKARHDLAGDLVAIAGHGAKNGIEGLDRRVRSFDHAAGLKQRAEALYGELAAEAGRDPPTERWVHRTKDLLDGERPDETQLLATRLIERMSKQRPLLIEFNARRSIADRYLKNLIGYGMRPTGEVEKELLRSLTLHQSWSFQAGLDSLARAQTLLLDLLATDANMDALESRILAQVGDISNEGIRNALVGRLGEGRGLRRESKRRDAYRVLEEVHHVAESSLAGQAATSTSGATPAPAVVGPVHEVTPPQVRPQQVARSTASGEEQAAPAPPVAAEAVPGAVGDTPGAAGAFSGAEGGEVEAAIEEEPSILRHLRTLSNDRRLLGLDTGELDGIAEDARRLWDADDASSAEVLIEFARRVTAPTPLPYTHGIEVELGLVYRDGSWVTGARVSQVIEDVVEEGIKRLRGLMEQGRVPSYVSERIVDMRIAQPEKPKRGKVIQLDYLLDGRLTTTEVVGRDAHGVGTTYILELVTPPCRHVEELLWWLSGLQGICREVLDVKHKDVLLISIGLNPAQPYSEGISFGDHHHIGPPDEPARRAAFNMLRAHVPHLIALTANSPIYKGSTPAIKWDGSHPIQFASRTDPLSIRLRQNIGQLGPVGSNYLPYLREGDGPNEFTAAVRKASPADARLVDIYPFTRFGTIEVRFFDAQLSIIDRVAMALILQALCRWGVRRARDGKAGPEVDPQVLLENRDRAIQMGMLLGFMRDRHLDTSSPEFARLYQGAEKGPHQKVKRLHDAVARMFENIGDELDAIAPGGTLGGCLDTYLVMVHGGSKRLLPPPITPGQFLLFQQTRSGKDVPGLIEYLDMQTHECARDLRHNPVTAMLGPPDAPAMKAAASLESIQETTASLFPSEGIAVETGTTGGPSVAAEVGIGTRVSVAMGDDCVAEAVLHEGGPGSVPTGHAEMDARAGTADAPTASPAVPVQKEGTLAKADRPGGGGASAPICRSCKTGVEWGFRFCPHCGGAISYSCPACDAPVEMAFRYCPVCGAQMPVNEAVRKKGG